MHSCSPLLKGGWGGSPLTNQRPKIENTRSKNSKLVLNLSPSRYWRIVSKLNDSNFHLPYNPKLIPIAKELRKNPTPAEKKLWQNFLRNFPFRVLRQRPIDNFIVDFYCAALMLVIEVDGENHFTEQGKQSDAERTAILEGYGLKVVRFTNVEVLQGFEGVCQELLGEFDRKYLSLDPP
jgi:very-short-patch-repair endonuclease